MEAGAWGLEAGSWGLGPGGWGLEAGGWGRGSHWPGEQGLGFFSGVVRFGHNRAVLSSAEKIYKVCKYTY